MIIEKVQKIDLESVFEINIQSLNSNWSKEAYINYLESDSILFLVAKVEDTVIGFIIFQIGEFQSDLLQIAIKSGVSHQGYGTALLKASLAFFTNNHEIFLEVDETNKSAIAFYQKNDFSQIGIRKNYYDNGNNALVFRKVI